MNHDEDADPVKASREFDEKLRNSPAYIDMHSTLRRRSIIGFILAFGLVINVALGIIAINAGNNAQHAVNQSGKALSQQHEQCVAGNIFRKNDYQTHIYEENFLAPKPRTPHVQALVDEFQKHFQQADKLRDCKKVK